MNAHELRPDEHARALRLARQRQRLVPMAMVSSVEHQTRQFDAITQGMTRDDLGIPVEVNRDDDVSWRGPVAHFLGAFARYSFAVLVLIGLAFWIVPVWLAL